MVDKNNGNEGPNQSNCSESYNDYLRRAAYACETGDLVLGMYLYLAAYEKAAADPNIPDGSALSGLYEAWHLACDLKERSMAEYVFEKLEPFLMPNEIAAYASELQDLALDRLESYGFSREDLEDIAGMISEDLEGLGGTLHIENIRIPNIAALGQEKPINLEDLPLAEDSDAFDEPDEDMTPNEKKKQASKLSMGVARVEDFNPYDMHKTSSVGTSYHQATNDGSGAYYFTRDTERAAESDPNAVPQKNIHEKVTAASEAIAQAMASMPSAHDGRGATPETIKKEATDVSRTDETKEKSLDTSSSKTVVKPQVIGPDQELEDELDAPKRKRLTYANLVGYDEAKAIMRDFGIGLQRDAAFRNFVTMLNSRHGLSEMPSLETVLFRAPVIEDAARFVEATASELGLPVLRMSMEENVQGMPVLCVTAQGNNRPRMNHTQNKFEGPGILVIEDLNLWGIPQLPEGIEGFGGLMMANFSRGAREAVNLIRSAVENPDVYVFATATTTGEVEPFFYELLEPMTIIDLAFPTESEREAIWGQIMQEHPSMRELNKQELARLSGGLSRYDIYMAAREAIEEAYKVGLMQRMFVPVSTQNIYDKIAACHMVDSQEYKQLEEEIVREFRDDLDNLDDLFGDSPKAWY